MRLKLIAEQVYFCLPFFKLKLLSLIFCLKPHPCKTIGNGNGKIEKRNSNQQGRRKQIRTFYKNGKSIREKKNCQTKNVQEERPTDNKGPSIVWGKLSKVPDVEISENSRYPNTEEDLDDQLWVSDGSNRLCVINDFYFLTLYGKATGYQPGSGNPKQDMEYNGFPFHALKITGLKGFPCHLLRMFIYLV